MTTSPTVVDTDVLHNETIAQDDSSEVVVVTTIPIAKVHRQSPAAQALFAAFDKQNSDGTSSNKKSVSSLLQKQIQTAGWRNRFSQDEYYPYEMDYNTTKNNNNDHDHDNTPKIKFTVQQIQCGEINNTYGTGATVWPAAIVLLKYLEYNSTTLIKHKIIIDLGAGTGITSIVCAYMNANYIICTDGQHPVVQLAYTNIHRISLLAKTTKIIEIVEPQNTETTTTITTDTGRIDLPKSNDTDISTATNMIRQKDITGNEEVVQCDYYYPIITINKCPIRTEFYWWGSGTIQLPSNEYTNNDNDDIVIIVSDCVLPKLYPIEPLVQAIHELLQLTTVSLLSSSSISRRRRNSLAILSYEYRYYPLYDPKEYFIQLCTKYNLIVETISSSQHHPLYTADDIEIWHVYHE